MTKQFTFEQTNNDVTFTTDFTMEDIEQVITKQMAVFKDEFGFTDEENEPIIELIRNFAKGLDPEKEFILLIKREETPVGSVFFTTDENGSGRLRFVYLDQVERGKGNGKKMIAYALENAKRNGYQHIWLSTYNILTVARNIYAGLSFHKVKEEPADWITSQSILEEIWELDF